jgi:signal transduction histidine kinase
VKPKLAVVFMLIVLAPLGALGWLGMRVAEHEDERIREGFSSLLLERLDDVEITIERVLAEWQRKLWRVTDTVAHDPPSLRALAASSGYIDHLFLLAPEGTLLFPNPEDDISEGESEFLYRTKSIWSDRHFFMEAGDRREAVDRRFYGWYQWYWEEGLRLIFWRRMGDGSVIGIDTNRSRLLADIIGDLPSTRRRPSSIRGRIVLLNAQETALYQWGPYTPRRGDEPMVSRFLDAPLATWRLVYYVAPSEVANFAPQLKHRLPLFFSLGAVGLALLVLAAYFYYAHTRSMREAAQKVTFVNQVSHELKTPLTNIRLYAELLATDADDSDPRTASHLQVIVSESRRLSRLIGNVLNLARKQRRKLVLHPAPGVVDEQVAGVLENFRESLRGKGVRVEVFADAPREVEFDADALEQILTNLFSNVEKYAAAGGYMYVATCQANETTTVTVGDRGPGIPAKDRETIFQPFHRLSNHLTDTAGGSGIGLSIARDLARLHGGDLVYLLRKRGACFRLTLHTPSAWEPETDANSDRRG